MDQFIDKMKFNKIVDKFFKYCFNCNILYYDSIDCYYSRKEPTLSRKIKFYLRYLIFFIFTIKYSLLSLYPDKLQGTTLTDITIIFGEQVNLVHALMLGIGIQLLLCKLTIVYFEGRKNFKVIDMFVDWTARKPIYQISRKHEKMLTLKAFIIYYGCMKIIGPIGPLIFTLMAIWTTIVTYLYHDYGNVITLWLWTIVLIIAFNEVLSISLASIFFFLIPITLLNYLFDELIEKLRVSIRWNNEQQIDQVLVNYDQLIGCVQQLSGPYNTCIGLIYCLVPYNLAIIIEIMNIDISDDLLSKLVKVSFYLLFIGVNIALFMINQISASITVRNKSIHKYLYPMFINERKRKLQIKLKIDSFIARLNTQFIGFYCFNLFEFTKMAFYQYSLTVSKSYFLITNIFTK